MSQGEQERASGRRVIFHVDMDAFFVSVEELYDPSLKGKAVVVGGRGHERGVVSAASYEARKFGVHSAMPLRTAYQKCPHAIFIDGHMERYIQHSREVRRILQSFSPKVEMASIDEAYLDMTGTERLFGPPLRAAHRLHEQVKRETRLNCSIGVASSRLVAKISSDAAKPNGIFAVMPGTESIVLAPLSVGKIPGVGKVTQEKLKELGILRVGDLSLLDESVLERRFGKWGLALAGKARGEDAGGWFDSDVGEEEDPKSISHEHTFDQDTAKQETLEAVLARMAEMVGRRLREKHLYARTVQLKLRDHTFHTITRAMTLSHSTQLDVDLLQAGRTLFRKNWKAGSKVRLIGLQASGLSAAEGQMDLLAQDSTERWRKATQAADALRDKFGDGAVSMGAAMKGKFRGRVHEAEPVREGKDKAGKRQES